jgi:anti-anti-sigma factor
MAIVKIQGYLDVTTCGELDELLADARRQHSWVILDLADVRFVDTRSLAVIVAHWKKLEARGGGLMLAGAQRRYIRALWVTGLASRMSLYDDVETAIAAAKSARTARSGD